MKKWKWLWLLAAVFCVNGVWTMVQIDKISQVTTRDIPHRDILENFGDVLGLWADEQELIDIEKLDIDCEIDDLLVETETTPGNQQAYSTITLTVNMYLNTDSGNDYLNIDYQELERELSKALKQSPYYTYIRTQTMNYYRADNEAFMYTDSVDQIHVGRGGSTGVKQEKKEKKAQKIAYDYAEQLGYEKFDDGTGTMRQYGFAQLTHFGFQQYAEEVYIEIELTSDHKEYNEAVLESLSACADDLYKRLKDDPTANKYIEEKMAKAITIVFYTPWDSEKQDHTYRYALMQEL